MANDIFPKSNLPIRKTSELLPRVFRTSANEKFIAGTVDPWVQPGKLDKTIGYVGRRYGKTFNSDDVYLDSDFTLRSRYQLEPAVVVAENGNVKNFYDYIDFKNQLRFFGNETNQDNKITDSEHYTWNPPIDWDKFVNFREYYWVPDGPPSVNILGQSQDIVSTYTVKLGVGSVFIFFPDGLSNNPTITLYRGQTYKFNINAPDNGFILRTGYDTGSLGYDPDSSYVQGQLVVYDGKLWRAKVDVPFTEGSTISLESDDWEYIEEARAVSILDYNQGVTNNGTINGTLTFKVPYDSPDVLFYQSLTDPNRFGRILIANIEENTSIDIDKEILGKKNYTSSNAVPLSNGMVVRFLGKVTPAQYKQDNWLVEGVGKEIKLIRFQDLTPPQISLEIPEVLFDNAGFDSEPFDDAISYPGTKDYIVINRASQDSNPWSRYNRWFHRSVLEFSYNFYGNSFDAPSTAKAKRPILEFTADLKLFNHGEIAKKSVDFVDTFTDDVFSKIEGSQGYIVDGEELFEGARLLVVADTDKLANNKIYQVNFINHSTGSGYRQEWSPKNSYRVGESVRYSGQSFSALTSLPSYQATVVQTFQSSKRIRIIKNLNIKIDQGVKFSGGIFGNLDPDQNYFVKDVFNDNASYTEFTLSLTKKGTVVSVINGAQGIESMIVDFAEHPTNVSFWTASRDRRQISLRQIADSDPIINQCVLIKRGSKNRGLMYHFNGERWIQSQKKTKVNLQPLFDVFDENQKSFSDLTLYPVSSFAGSEIISYKPGSSIFDPELNLQLSYLNIDNIGDILFEFDWEIENFNYEIDRTEYSKSISTGFYKFSNSNIYGNCWTPYDRTYDQPIIYSTTLEEGSDRVDLYNVKWETVSEDQIKKISLYINGIIFKGNFTRDNSTFKFDSIYPSGTTITCKLFCDIDPDLGYYEFPLDIEKNPLNDELKEFTLGQASDHVGSGLELFDDIVGIHPGLSNLRDLDGYQPLMRRFIKHAGISALAVQLLCDKQVNLIRALEYGSKAYRDFKNNFIRAAAELTFNDNIPDLLDEIIVHLSRVKTPSDAHFDSDMIGAGAYSSIDYIVDDEGIKIFALSQKFDLKQLSRLAIYVYINGIQLLHEVDYSFDSVFGFVKINQSLNEGDKIQIREYVSSAFNFIPATPTKLGLYKKFTPRKFLDDTYIEPTYVIQGHDGSITVAYNDYRDNLILELEKRIYNNLKFSSDTKVYDIDNIFSGYYGNTVYNKEQFDSFISKQFRRWALESRTDFVENTFFDTENSFTFTYSRMTDPTGKKNLPGYWRGVYQWFYDTSLPHITPWEMLGFSQKPDWWEKEYGPAPYTRDNLVLWEDLANGIVRQGSRAGTYDRYKRPTLLNHIPTDSDGNLLDPLESGLAGNYVLQQSRGDFKFGDISPTEYAWRSSSEYPFAVMIALCISRPFEFITSCIDLETFKINLIGQQVSKNTKKFFKIADLQIPQIGSAQTSGLINFIVDFLKSRGMDVNLLSEKFFNIDVKLSTRLSGFVDQSQQKYLLDSKNPSSKSSSIFIPQENYNIFFHTSAPIEELTYSGIIVEKTTSGYKVYGYDNLEPVFKYYQTYSISSDPLISVGGKSENFTDWEPGKVYNNGVLVRVNDRFYRCILTHSSTAPFDNKNWRVLPKLPTVNAVTAFKRNNFNRNSVKLLEYGHRFNDKQSLVDFIFGYEEYLKSKGFVFDQYDPDLGVNRDWTASVKEFLFWTVHNWTTGSLISLSPSANNIRVNSSVGVIENLTDSFYDYLIYRSNGSLITPNQLNVNRDFQTISIETVNNNDGIYLVKLYPILKEHVTIFSDRTIFNDVLFDKTTGYRQERLKSRGFRTVDWDGDYTSPGFIFDNVKIESWEPYVDYNLGDIVSYRSFNWTSLEVQKGEGKFNESKWSKLDFTPSKQLIPNFDFRANQFEDFYDLDSDGVGQSQRDQARHLVGYQKRNYLEELAEDEVIQMKLYQGFIREKGTFNAVDKIFNKLAKTVAGSIELNEDWAFRLGNYGGQDQTYQIEFSFKTSDLVLNPQPVEIIQGPISDIKVDQILRLNSVNFDISPQPFTASINPTAKYIGNQRSAGYVRTDQVDIVLKEKTDLLFYDIYTIDENAHIWFTFDLNSWSVFRFNAVNSIIITLIERDKTNVRIYTNKRTNLSVGEIFGIKDIPNLNGFHVVVSVTSNYIDITIPLDTKDPVFDESTIGYNLYFLTKARFQNYQALDLRGTALLKENSKLWIDDGYSSQDKWQVIKKNKRYTDKTVGDYLITDPRSVGKDVVYADVLKQSIFSLPASGAVASAVEFRNELELKQLITPSADYVPYLNQSFGDALAISPDNVWLAVGVPRASGVRNDYVGSFDPLANYVEGDTVLYAGRLWKALEAQNADGSSIEIDSDKWQLVDLMEANVIGDYTGPSNQGMVVMYRYTGSQWNTVSYILSPRMETDEYFGSKISLSVSGSKYYMAISAPGAANNLGRVYLYVYESGSWKILQNNLYKGVYDPNPPTGWTNGKPYQYPLNSIVYHRGKYYKSLEDQNGDGSSIYPDDRPWQQIEPYRIVSHLPQKTAYNDDGSTLEYGINEDSTLAISRVEMIKAGDMFGSSISMNRDGSILAVGVPNADEEFFDEFKGEWSAFQTYKTGDVVKWFDPIGQKYSYRRLFDPRSNDSINTDSTEVYISLNESPEGDPWETIGDSSSNPTGKVFIYKRNLYDQYELKQTISATNISSFNDTGIFENIATGDQFGHALDIDYNGTTLVVTSPRADLNFVSQGSSYVFTNINSTDPEFRLKQKLESYEEYPNEFFGSNISISPRAERIAVSATNARFKAYTYFDNGTTTFEGNKTKFFENRGNSGQVYVFEKKDETFILSEKLDTDLEDFESFGHAVDIVSDVIITGSPGYRRLITSGNFVVGQSYIIKDVGNTNWQEIGYNGDKFPYAGLSFTATGLGQGTGRAFANINQGKVRLFTKTIGSNIWSIIAEESNLVNLDKFNNIALVDNINSIKLADLDVVDHYKLKILGLAEQEINFKTLYDPATYNIGTDIVEVDNAIAWKDDHVGQLWWDISTAKFINSEQGEISYRAGNFNKQTPYSSIDVYEWVESKYLPSVWATLADTNTGLAQGISGTPKHNDDSIYSFKVLFNPLTGETTDTKYYFWVKNKTTIPEGFGNRRISASEVASIIRNPEATGTPFISIIDADKFLFYNFESVVRSDTVSVNILYSKEYKSINPVHKEYQLLTEGIVNDIPNEKLERKWIDSLIGYDQSGKKVPDETLYEKQKYGISFRPRQSMFKDRFQILNSVLDNINSILLQKSFAETISFVNLNKTDQVPNRVLNEYDVVVSNFIDLQNIGTNRVTRPILTTNIVDGKIESINIVNSGFGYRVTPFIEIEGDGVGAKAEIIIDNTGRIIRANVTQSGRNYTSAVIKIRNFSVLVENDETIKNYWAIYAWDDNRQVFVKSKIQSFNTPLYWEYIDWYLDGYGITSRVTREIIYLFEEEKFIIETGDIIKVKEFGSGGWALLERVQDSSADILDKYRLVGRQSGTIRIKKDDFLQTNKIGFDTVGTFDGGTYDLQPTIELRNIFQSVKEDIFVDELAVEWNKLFFTSIRYVFTQFDNIDWVFKTSFINALHKIGNLSKKPNYRNDNLDSYLKYLEEIKPYRTTIREFTSGYSAIDQSDTAFTDFDSPPTYSKESGRVLPVGENYDRFSEYPWKWFADYQGFSVLNIEIFNSGSGYDKAPTVLIEGDGQGAAARAFISNGGVSGIEVINIGSGYTYAPRISLVGGNGSNPDIAKATAIIGNSKVRSFDLSMVFDRIDKSGQFLNFEQNDTFIAQGFTATFDLKYAPNIDKRLINVYVNSELKLSTEYRITLFYSEINGLNVLKGKITFVVTPAAGSVILVQYEKNDNYLNAIDRIEKYYAPQSGMKGKEISQLMTGIDFGGVQIQGTTFDITGGWDALPWFTDNWDSVESSSDFYFIVDGSTTYVDLPYTPSQGELVSIYLKRSGQYIGQNINTLNDPTINPVYQILPAVNEPRTIRIDDPNWNGSWDSTIVNNPPVGINVNAVMPSFIGDGINRRVEFNDQLTNIPYINFQSGDTLIFRSQISDGTVVINDNSVIDTRLSGGSLAAISGVYQTATGRTVDEIVIDGKEFISPDQVPAPEENIPGQVLESLSIKCFQSKDPGAASIRFNVYIANGIRTEFPININIMESKSLLVYLDKIKIDDSTVSYEINYLNDSIVFASPPEENTIVEIIGIGIGGIQILDYQDFIGDGLEDKFLTNALFDQTTDVFVTVNGEIQSAVYFDSREFTDKDNRTMVQLAFKPTNLDKIKIICLGSALDTDSIGLSLVRINSQEIIWDGSSRMFELDSFVNLSRASATSSILVEINGTQLNSVDTVVKYFDGANNIIFIGKDPEFLSGDLTINDIDVYINNVLQTPIIVYTFSPSNNTVTVNTDYLTLEDEIKIILRNTADFLIINDNLVFSDTIIDSTLNLGDIISVTWFSEYPSFNLVTDQYIGGKNQYQLKRIPLADDYIFVYINGIRQTKNKDYAVDFVKGTVTLKAKTFQSDTVIIKEFGSEVWRFPSAFEINKDMLNINHYTRLNENNVVLVKDLNYYDDTIEVNFGNLLADPISEKVPGIVLINKEKIEYFEKNGNVLSGLRRGTYGTPIAEIHQKKSDVVDVGFKESIPYSDTQEKYSFLSDGSTLLFGPLDFVPAKATRTSWIRTSIPDSYGACDQVEVFVGGRRLRKNSTQQYNQELGIYSPSADETIEAEFSVDGVNPYIRLSEPVEAGVRVLIIRRLGKIWYDKGSATASTGQTLSKNDNAVARFIFQKTISIPE